MRKLSLFTPDWSHNLSPNLVMGDVFEDFDRVVNSFWRPNSTTSLNFYPSCDIKQTKENYFVSFDLPGMKKEDIKIEVQNNQLIISGERHDEMREEDGETTLRHECTYGKFERTFSLPTTINAEKIEAHYENGVLNVVLPKEESAKGKTIQIQSGQGGFLNKLLGNKKEDPKELKNAKVS